MSTLCILIALAVTIPTSLALALVLDLYREHADLESMKD